MPLNHVLFGRPLSSKALHSQCLSKAKALPILSSDALSSVAYGTEEILRVLVLAGIAGLSMSLPIALAICCLIAILGASYWQTIHAYPNGGGAFTVARENLGASAGLLAAAALLLDYLLTVAVSISAGIRAVTSAFPNLLPYTVLLCLLTILFITWMNLRGVRESASVFALPTYAFIGLVFFLFIMAAWRLANHDLPPMPLPDQIIPVDKTLHAITVLLILRAFSAGCSALTGIECVANGVQVFRTPQVNNACKTLLIMVVLLGLMFFGISYLTHTLNILPRHEESLLSELGHLVFGDSYLYYALQTATALILLLAANTAFTGFPRLASILAENKYLPKQLSSLGDRLSFSNGIVVLAGLSCFLVIIFKGDTHRLIPLYSVGVFLAFSLSQLGMVKRWHVLRTKAWRSKAMVNLLGFITTTIALLVIIDSKFLTGAWVIIILIPVCLIVFTKIHRHYSEIDHQLAVTVEVARNYLHKTEDLRPKVILPVSKIHRGTLAAIKFARSASNDVTAVAVDINPQQTRELQMAWQQLEISMPLVILASPYRSVMSPLRHFINQQDHRDPHKGLCMIVLPKAVTTRWWHALLHNHRATLFKALLYYNRKHKGNTRIFVDVPYHLAH